MNGRKLKTRSFKMLISAFALALMIGFGIASSQQIKALNADDVVTFDTSNDTVVVKNKTVAYTFYTTANASKSVPAQNQWLRTNNGSVDVSCFTAGKILYFAMSTAPNKEDIVPVKIAASPVLTKATYDAKTGSFIFKAKVSGTQKYTDKKGVEKTKSITDTIDVPVERIQIKLNDNSAVWQDFKTAMTDANKAMLQKEGATIYARIKPSSQASAAIENNMFVISDAGTNKIVSNDDSKTYNAATFVRYGVSKAVKITKKSLGPAMTIDYANHAVTFKKGQSYGTTTNAYADPTKWTEFSNADAKITSEKIYFGTKGYVSADEYYAFKTNGVSGKTQDSLLSFVAVPKTVAFANTSEATIQGGYNEAATLLIKYSPEVKAGVAYQYAIVDLSDADHYKDLIATKAFDYSNANVKWITIKTDKTGVAKASLAWTKINGKQVIVRKAAVGKEYSSAVEIFNAPTGTGLASYAASATTALKVNCWTKLTNDTYGTGFASNNTSMTFCPNITTPVYNVADETLTYSVIGGNSSINYDKMTMVIGKKTISGADIKEASLGVAENISTTISKKAYTAPNYKITVKLAGIADYASIAKSDALAFTFKQDAGLFTVGGIQSVAKSNAMKIDNKPVTLKSATVKQDATTPTSGTITLTFDSQLKVVDASGNDVDLAQNDFAGSAFTAATVTTTGTTKAVNVKFASGKYSWNAKKATSTIVINYTNATKYGQEFTITLPKELTDFAGNCITGGDASILVAEGTNAKGAIFKVANPCYE